jgi:hypothetical protein
MVFPAAAPLCYPEVSGQRLVTRHDAVRSDWTVEWVRASRSDAGWVVVYYVPSDEQGRKGSSFRIARPKKPR